MAISWNASLEIGVADIDRQHKALFTKLDALLDAVREGKAQSTIGETLKFLTDYAVEHFSSEEALMEEIQYPHLREHKALHEAFISTVKQLKQQFEAGINNDALAIELKKQVFDWLWSHIGREDRKIAAFLAG